MNHINTIEKKQIIPRDIIISFSNDELNYIAACMANIRLDVPKNYLDERKLPVVDFRKLYAEIRKLSDIAEY